MKEVALKVDGVKDAVVRYIAFRNGRADVTYDPRRTTPEAIAKFITESSGYVAQVFRPDAGPSAPKN